MKKGKSATGLPFDEGFATALLQAVIEGSGACNMDQVLPIRDRFHQRTGRRITDAEVVRTINELIAHGLLKWEDESARSISISIGDKIGYREWCLLDNKKHSFTSQVVHEP